MANQGWGAAGVIAAGLRDIATGSAATVERAVNEDRIRLAVTGLSRAGKTVFITSLIQNLLALGHGRDTLRKVQTRLTQDGASRLRRVEVLPAGAGVLPFFDQVAKLRDLAAEQPSWPPRTEDVAQISLALELNRASTIGKRLGTRRVRLDILDYPGEWLLDLPLLEQDFAAWSAQCLEAIRQPPRSECFADFLAFIGDLRPDDRAEESLLHKGHLLYREALHACRREHGLRYLQPGRFICPGPSSEAPFMWFFPMQVPAGSPKLSSAAALLQERFAAYQQHVRATFFDTHFVAFDRQVMLVDVLGALHAGRAAFQDTAHAIADLAATLRYGSNSVARTVVGSVARGASQLLPTWLGRSADAAAQRLGHNRIERVVFVATKADHVPALSRENLKHLLRALAAGGAQRHGNGDASVSYQVAASIRSTQDSKTEMEGRPVEVVRGVMLGESKARAYFPGNVPISMPSDTFWSDKFFELPVFRPPPIDAHGMTGIPHLNLDLVLDDLIGDLL